MGVPFFKWTPHFIAATGSTIDRATFGRCRLLPSPPFIMRPILRFAALDTRERALLLRALGALISFRLALWTLPFPRIQKWLEKRSISPSNSGATWVSAPQIARAIGRCQVLVPRSTCLVQALAAHSLLRRAGHVSQLRLGVIKRDGELLAHAWVECEGLVIVGGEIGDYTPIYRWQGSV